MDATEKQVNRKIGQHRRADVFCHGWTRLHLRSPLDLSTMGPMSDLVETLARQVYLLAGAAEDRAACPIELARRILGSDGVIVGASELSSEGYLLPVGGQWRIVVRRGLTRRRLAHVVGHELGHWICRCEGVPDDEPVCDAIGAAIVAPARAYVAALSRRPPRLRGLAWLFSTSESLVALRYAEVTGEPLALVTPERVRVRGAYDWPPESKLRALAQSGGGEGLRATRLLDDPRRVVLAPTSSGLAA